MKKENYYKFLYFISGLLILGFCIRLGADYIKYDSIQNSAPFYAFVLIRTIEFIVPSIIVFVMARFAKSKITNK